MPTQPEASAAGQLQTDPPAAQDVALFHAIGSRLANGTAWPQWRAGSEFKAVRDKDRGAARDKDRGARK